MDKPYVTEGLRAEVAMRGEAVDPLTGRVCVMDEDGTVVFKVDAE